MEEDKKQFQEDPEENINHWRRQQHAYQGEKQQAGGLIALTELQGGNIMRPRLVRIFSKSSNPKEIYGPTITTRQQLILASLRWGGGGGINTYGKREVVDMLNEYKQFHNLDLFGPQDTTIISLQGKLEHSDMLILLKKSGAVKSKEGRAQMGSSNAPISYKNKQSRQPSHQKQYFHHYLLMPMKGEWYM